VKYVFITARSELRKVLFLPPSVCVSFYLCMKYLDLTAERICTKFTRMTCLVIRSDEFERSKVKVIRDKNAVFVPFGGLCVVYV